ncbi:MAG: Fic family protein, partial [Acidobacteria bacterium]|nr:Fic family protein [Acidobacteriota bacterium]
MNSDQEFRNNALCFPQSIVPNLHTGPRHNPGENKAGVTIDYSRIDIVLFGDAPLQDSDEREVRGYADALTVIHQQAEKLPVSEQTILRLHRLSRSNVGDAGQYKRKDSEIIEKYPDGRERVRFKPVSAQETPAFMGRLIEAWQQCQEGDRIHPLTAMAAMSLDF